MRPDVPGRSDSVWSAGRFVWEHAPDRNVWTNRRIVDTFRCAYRNEWDADKKATDFYKGTINNCAKRMHPKDFLPGKTGIGHDKLRSADDFYEFLVNYTDYHGSGNGWNGGDMLTIMEYATEFSKA